MVVAGACLAVGGLALIHMGHWGGSTLFVYCKY